VLPIDVTDSVDPTIRFDLTEQIFPGGQDVLVDATPGQHEEFAETGSGQLQAQSGTAADGRIDLLAVLLHEMSHAPGSEHEDASGHSTMSEEPGTGQRRLAEADVDLQFSLDGGLLDVL
jgi:hypothetical protein